MALPSPPKSPGHPTRTVFPLCDTAMLNPHPTPPTGRGSTNCHPQPLLSYTKTPLVTRTNAVLPSGVKARVRPNSQAPGQGVAHRVASTLSQSAQMTIRLPIRSRIELDTVEPCALQHWTDFEPFDLIRPIQSSKKPSRSLDFCPFERDGQRQAGSARRSARHAMTLLAIDNSPSRRGDSNPGPLHYE